MDLISPLPNNAIREMTAKGNVIREMTAKGNVIREFTVI